MLLAKSQFLDSCPVGAQTDEPKVEWVSSQTNARTFLAAAASGGDIAGSATAVKIGCGTGYGTTVPVGSIIRNSSLATPLGTYKVDEILQVTANDGTDLTVTRDYGRNGTTPGQGSTAHTATATWEVLFVPRQEGSVPDLNKYKPTTTDYNYTSILDFYLTVTGTEMARRPLIVADNMARQYEDRMTELKNDLSQFILYGATNKPSGTETGGADTAIRTTKGVLQALAQANGNVDYASTVVSESAINKLFETILSNGCERVAPYKIVCHPQHARIISGFGADKVRIERVDKTWGRYLTTFVSDLGFEAEIVADPLVSKSNLFVLNMSKVELVPFRPWQKLEWGMDTSTPDGSDSYKMRVVGEYTVRVIDPLKAHGVMTLLSW